MACVEPLHTKGHPLVAYRKEQSSWSHDCKASGTWPCTHICSLFSGSRKCNKVTPATQQTEISFASDKSHHSCKEIPGVEFAPASFGELIHV